MKFLSRLLLVSALAGSVVCQSVSTEELIRRIIDQGEIEGRMVGRIGPIGDSAAVTVIKILGGRNLTPTQVERILLVLNISFADLRSVEHEVDRQPRAALFLLKSLDASVRDSALKKKIDDTRRFVIDQAAKSAKSS